MDSFQDADLLKKFKKLVKEVKETPLVKPEPIRNIHLKGVTAYDPMSPYTPPETPKKFSTITDVINNKFFKGCYPQSYTPVPEYFRRYGISPYYDPEDFTDYARGALTIANMIELTFNDQPWKLDRIQDIPLILAIVEDYYAQMRLPGISEDISVKAYRAKVEKFLSVLRAADAKVRNRHEVKEVSDNLINIIKKLVGR